MTAIRILRGTGTVLLGFLMWPFLLPYGAKRLLRQLRKVVKPLRLWLIECQIEKSREIALCLEGQRVEAALMIQEENQYQAALAAKRIAIERNLA